jgi:hypothetical protein
VEEYFLPSTVAQLPAMLRDAIPAATALTCDAAVLLARSRAAISITLPSVMIPFEEEDEY